MSPLTDSDAATLIDQWENVPAADQPQARERLRLWDDGRRKREGEVYRSVESLMLDGEDTWAKSYPDQAKPIVSVPDPDRSAAWDDMRETAGLALLTGQDSRRIAKAPGAFRAAVADSWGEHDIATDVPKFRARLKAHFQKSRDTRLLGDDLAINARKAEVLNGALLDPAIIPTWDKWSQESGSKPGFSPWQTGAYFQKWSDERKATREKLAAVKDDVEAVWSILGGGGEPRGAAVRRLGQRAWNAVACGGASARQLPGGAAALVARRRRLERLRRGALAQRHAARRPREGGQRPRGPAR